MSFSLPRFLRRVQPSDLRRYFAAHDIPFSEQVDWTAKPVALLVSMKAAIESLPDRDRERVFEDFERIEQLSDEIGQRALQSVVEQDEVLLRQLHCCHGSEARGLFVLLTNEEAFDHALATAYAERMRHGRSWSGYCLPAPLAPSKNPSDITLLEGDLSALFHQFDGTGRKLKIEPFERNTAESPVDPCRQVIHYSVYVKGLPECSVVFEGDVERRLAIARKHCKIVRRAPLGFGNHADARVATRFRSRPVEKACFLSHRSSRWGQERRGDPSSAEKYCRRFGRVTIEIDDADHGDIHARSACWFGDSDPLRRPDWQVTQGARRQFRSQGPA